MKEKESSTTKLHVAGKGCAERENVVIATEMKPPI